MKFFHMMMVFSMFVYMSMFVGVVAADPGFGACAAGNGVSIGIDVDGSFTGVNVGQNSATGIYSDQADYETQCCAESGSPPDCFEPVEA